MNASLDSVLQHPGIWRGNQLAQTGEDVLPTGFAELDELLPGGGWPRGALTEILAEREGIGELRLLLPALARVSEQSRWQAWVAPPHLPYAPAHDRYARPQRQIRALRHRAAMHGHASWADRSR